MLLSKFQRDSGWIKGSLNIQEAFDKELHRWCRVATVRPDAGLGFPDLFDATVIMLSSHWMTVTGFERVYDANPSKLVSYQQSWLIVPRTIG